MLKRFSSIEPLEARIAPAFAASVDLAKLNGTNGFKFTGTGYTSPVSGAGDVNGDGFDDLIIGNPFADPNGTDSGSTYIVFGKQGGFTSEVNLSALNGTNGFKINGLAATSGSNRSGWSVSAAGDVNGDGFDDVLIGNGLNANAQSAFVVFGKAQGFAPTLELSALNGTNGFRMNGAGGAFNVGAAGDVNGDGFDDVVIGAQATSFLGRSLVGAAYVVFGKPTGFASAVTLSSLNGSDGFRLEGAATSDKLGTSVSGADFNGDGFSDLIIGASKADGYAGAVYVYFGKRSGFASATNVSSLNGSNGFKLAGSGEFGKMVSAGGNVNGDGLEDLLVGTAGEFSYVVFGTRSSFAASAPIDTLADGANGFRITPGYSFILDATGDLNGDGFDDLLMASTVVFSKATFPATFEVPALNGKNGFEIESIGNSGAVAGDVNGDGFDDLIFDRGVVFGSGVAVSVSDASVTEGNAGTAALQFTVSLSEAGTIPVSVKLATVNGTALAGSDFKTLVPATLTFAPGELSKTFTVEVLGDTSFESDETFSLVLSDATGGVIRKAMATGTIANDDVPPLVSIGNASVLEGDNGTSNLVFTVSLSEASGLPATVNFAVANGTALAGSDFTALTPGTLTFAPGETTKTVTIQVLGDNAIEDPETFSVVLSEAAGASIGTGTATGTILNDDTALRIVGPGSLLEGNTGTTPFAFTVSLEKASALPVTVSYATANGTAVAGSDFVASTAGSELIFAPGETTRTVTVDVLGDTTIEDHETFSVVLSAASNAALAVSSATATILNDETAVRIGDVTLREGDADKTPFAFTVSLEKASALPVAVSYTTTDGTALVGSDFVAIASGAQLTFAPGETSKLITIDVLGDAAVEAHETFSVVLSPPTNATLTQATAVGTILNDETRIAINDTAVLEGHSGTRAMTFAVSLSASTALPVSVDFASADGTAIAGLDYTALLPGNLAFAPGETSKTITVEVLADTLVDKGETFSVVLSGGVNGVIDDDAGIGTILDDDAKLTGKRTATFTGVDGDLVTIAVSKGTLKVEDFTLYPEGSGAQLALVDFSGDTQFTGANLTVSAKRAPGAAGGARFVDVGYINATGIDLGNVVIKGDLGRINAGDGFAAKPALLSLSARSLGFDALGAQLPDDLSLVSELSGAVKSLNLADGMHASLSVAGDIGILRVVGDVRNSLIKSDGKIGTITVTGDVVGSNVGNMFISARGQLAPTSNAQALAIGSIHIGGSVDHALILAGFDRHGFSVSGDANIGSVRVGGNWSASSLAAGVIPDHSGFFGTADDKLTSANGPIVSRIASILIKGTATGTQAGTDHFGFVAEEIGAFKAGGVKLTLQKGAGNDLSGLAVGASGDLTVREVV